MSLTIPLIRRGVLPSQVLPEPIFTFVAILLQLDICLSLYVDFSGDLKVFLRAKKPSNSLKRLRLAGCVSFQFLCKSI